MIQRYIHAAMRRARYEIIIEDAEPFYGEVPGLAGVWAAVATLEDCRDRLESAVEDWLVFSLVNGFEVPPLDGMEFPRSIAATG